MSRTYLSIGDVLSLLREEFPDVTISKIRFLESQGLVDPERSPSGYRKFYDDDVARLRWVLRKQRDQFLPLKVIRDRLAAAGTGVPPDDEPVWNGDPAWRAGEEVLAVPPALREDTHTVVGAVDQARNGAADPRTLPGEGCGAHEAVGPAAAASENAPVAAGGGLRTVASQSAAIVVAERTSITPPEDRPSSSEVEEGRVAHGSGYPAAASAVQPPGRTNLARGATGPHGHSTTTSGPGDVLSPSLSGVSLTLPELCAATGLTPQLVASLEGLGLLTPLPVAGGTYYDEEALTVGKLVVEFGRFGIEPRHLKMYRNSVEREVGLVEQVIMPLLRQRNPEARQRAVDAAAELARLGQSMRASLVRTELRRLLGT